MRFYMVVFCFLKGCFLRDLNIHIYIYTVYKYIYIAAGPVWWGLLFDPSPKQVPWKT